MAPRFEGSPRDDGARSAAVLRDAHGGGRRLDGESVSPSCFN
jgi:hypothetical protein